MEERIDYIWNTLTEFGIATDDEIDLVTKISGKTEENLNQILYVRTGYRDLKQMFDAE